MNIRRPFSRLAGIALAAALIFSATACNVDSSTAVGLCTDEFVFGVNISVLDATTSNPISSGITGEITEGAYREVMTAFGNVLVGAGERQGTYRAEVAAQGYQNWVLEDISVSADECHVIPVEVTARLQPVA